MTAQAAIRLSTIGADQARADIASLGAAGDKTAQQLQRAMEQAGAAGDAAQRRYAAAAAKLAAITPQSSMQMAINDAVGTGFGQFEGSAKTAAAALATLLAEEEALDERGRTLRATLDPLSVAQDKFNASLANADQLLLTGRISLDEYTAAEAKALAQLEATTAAMERQSNASRLSAAMPDTALQAQIHAAVSSGFGEFQGSAAASAAAMAPLLAAEEQLEARTRNLVAAIDPLAAAQQRANTMVAEARALFDAGKISAEQLAKAEQLAEQMARGMGNGHQGASVQTMMLQSAMFRTTESIASGMPVWRIAIQQGTEVVAALGMGGKSSMGGALGAVADFMAGPWGIAVMAGAAALAVLIPKLIDGANAAEQMKKHQEELGSIIDHTTGKITEQSKALILNAAILTQKDAKTAQDNANKAKQAIIDQAKPVYVPGSPTVGGMGQYIEQNPQISAAIAAFQKNGAADQLAQRLSAIGAARPQLKSTTDEIIAQGAAFVTADRQAQQYAAQVRLLTGQGKPGDQRLAVGQFGPEKTDASMLDAEAKLAAATNQRERAEAQATITHLKLTKARQEGTISDKDYVTQMAAADKAVNDATQHTDRHAQSLARQADAMKVNAAAGIALAEAYLQGGSAAVIAEAQRKGAVDATKKGIDAQAQTQRQLSIDIADGIVAGAKSTAQLRDETAIRKAANDNVAAGTIAIADINRAIADETQLRPLLILQALAPEGKVRDELTKVINAQRAALAGLHEEEARSQAAQTLQSLNRRIEDANLQKDHAGDTSGDLQRARAALTGNREADDRKYSAADRAAVVGGNVKATNAELDASHAQYQADALRSQQDGLQVTQAEIGLIGKSATEHDKVINRLQLQQKLAVDLGSDYAKYAPAILKSADAAEDARAKLKDMQTDWQELNQFGDKFLDDVLNPDNWTSFGNVGKMILKDLEQEFIKLALLNPLKNALFGEKNATLGSIGGIFGSIGKLFGHNASGTEYWSGGGTYLAENGPELVNLPRGSRVSNASDTRRTLSAANDPAQVHVTVGLDNEMLVAQTIQVSDSRIMAHAPGIAHAGSVMAQAEAMKRARRRIPTR